MVIKIKPVDTLFFKDGKPFNMGEETWANGVFPPYPSTFFGALRTLYFANNIDKLHLANEENDPTKNLQIKGIYLKNGDDILFPLPFDCVTIKSKKSSRNAKAYLLSLEENNLISHLSENIKKVLTYKGNEKVETREGAYINDLGFKNDYLNGKSEILYQLLSDNIFNEPKIGIGRSNITHSSEEGKLYRVDMKRLRNVEFLIQFEGLDITDNGLIKLGGEGKAVNFEKYDDIKIEPPKFDGNEKYFKLYLSTPAIFKKGWLPNWIDKTTLIGEYNGIRVKLLTVALGKPLSIGGFDVKNRRPKTMYKVVPAGSVYYFDLCEGNIGDVIKYFHGSSISDINSNEGFGISYVGKVK